MLMSAPQNVHTAIFLNSQYGYLLYAFYEGFQGKQEL